MYIVDYIFLIGSNEYPNLSTNFIILFFRVFIHFISYLLLFFFVILMSCLISRNLLSTKSYDIYRIFINYHIVLYYFDSTFFAITVPAIRHPRD